MIKEIKALNSFLYILLNSKEREGILSVPI